MEHCVRSYRIATTILTPLIPLWLYWRAHKGKEDKTRIKERFGSATISRPKGTLFWIHAASVGEANSILPLLGKMREQFSNMHLLLTTGTVTSARLMAQRLPSGVIHQYVPIDTPAATSKFISHWRPDFAFFVESELWPNLLSAANNFGAFMGIINARMSGHSLHSWQKRPHMISEMLSYFDVIFAQSDEDAMRLRTLGGKEPLCFGNVKYDAAMLHCDENEMLVLKDIIGTRPVWLAASTHAGEETIIAQAHHQLKNSHPNLLTIIVPRHAQRGPSIAQELAGISSVALRSKREPIDTATGIYIADSMGELGLFYRLSEIVFMGGSLIKHGGQNPLEPARLSCAIVTGHHTHNFADIYSEMEIAGACIRVENMASLVQKIDILLHDSAARDLVQTKARKWLKDKGGTSERIINMLEPALLLQRVSK
jgi:3-deoxy-D-manno-octulosonic-acid transferase